jgi:hypothetical protein
MSDESRRFSQWILPVGLGALVVVLVVIALSRGPVDLDPDTPEGTVQEYLVAIDEERWDDAVAVIHPDWLGECDGTDLSRFAQGEFTAELGAPGGFDGGIVREDFATIGEGESAALPGSEETVEVTIRHTDQGGVFGTGWNEYAIFELSNDDDFWWIVSDPWPYFVWNCRE